MPETSCTDPVEIVDGEDRACGELLVVLAARARRLAPGSAVRLIATDPAAAVDLPAWCHLTGHHFLGAGRQGDGRAHYDLMTASAPRPTHPDHPWRIDTTDRSATPNREDHHP